MALLSTWLYSGSFRLRRPNNCIYLLVLLVSLQICRVTLVEVMRPRGVALTKKVFYDPRKDFTCIDGSLTIPFRYVNDDYCDCDDGTDEPGTAACPNGVFHCTNAGHKPLYIPSSRVNDGICDCCDASDEYNSTANCINHCKELGRRAREEAQRQFELLSKGFEIKQDFSRQGQAFLDTKKEKLAELEKEKAQVDIVKADKEATKKAIEDLESAALEKYKNEEEERKKLEEAKRLQEEHEKEAEAAFNDMDVDKNDKITMEEIQGRWVFDTDKDGKVSEEEAKVFLLNKDELDREEFMRTGWMVMKPHYSLQQMFKPPGETDEETIAEPTEVPHAEEPDPMSGTLSEEFTTEEGMREEEEEEEEEDDDEEEGGIADPPKFPTSEGTSGENDSATAAPQYDEETQNLVNAANAARKEFDEIDKKSRDLDNEISVLKKTVEIDYGPQLEFAPLYGTCLEYSDREYIYRLCLFERATQKQKVGNSETNLGMWGMWYGPEENKYAKMKYEHGLTCWNGPARSVEAVLSCGSENKISSVAEPNRCEYVFEVTTPAACNSPSKQPEMHLHDEF